MRTSGATAAASTGESTASPITAATMGRSSCRRLRDNAPRRLRTTSTCSTQRDTLRPPLELKSVPDASAPVATVVTRLLRTPSTTSAHHGNKRQVANAAIPNSGTKAPRQARPTPGLPTRKPWFKAAAISSPESRAGKLPSADQNRTRASARLCSARLRRTRRHPAIVLMIGPPPRPRPVRQWPGRQDRDGGPREARSPLPGRLPARARGRPGRPS